MAGEIEEARQAGSKINVTVYPEATHDFDDPSSQRQSVAANQAALNDVQAKAIATVARWKN